jgi:hypothetical protein
MAVLVLVGALGAVGLFWFVVGALKKIRGPRLRGADKHKRTPC